MHSAAASAAGVAYGGAAAGAGGRGGLLPVQPAGPAEFERRFGAEHGVTQLCRTGILCQNSGHHGSTSHHGNIEIIHIRAPLFPFGSWVVFPNFLGILYSGRFGITRPILA